MLVRLLIHAESRAQSCQKVFERGFLRRGVAEFLGFSLLTSSLRPLSCAVTVTTGRVSGRCCHYPLPSEPDMILSYHPAQADTKPRMRGAGFTTVYSWFTGR